MDEAAFRANFGDDYYESMPTVGAAVADVLTWFGAREIFGVGGDYAASLVRALEGRAALCPSSNEANAAFSACAAAELGGVGACLATYTVGSLPCLSAAALAMAERLPVVFLSGAPAEAELHQAGLHHTLVRADSWRPAWDGALSAFRAIGARAERLAGARNPRQPNIAGEQFFELVAHAYLRREPVFVEIPRDVVAHRTQTLKLPPSPRALVRSSSQLDGAAHIAAHVEAKLRACRAPLAYLGEKVRGSSELQASILRLCEKLGIPFATSIFAKGIFGDEHPLSLGTYNGVFSRPRTRAYVEREVDFVLEIGTSTYPQDLSSAFYTRTNAIETHPNKVTIVGTSLRETDEQRLVDRLCDLDIPPFSFRRPAPQPVARVADDEPAGFHNLVSLLDEAQAGSERALVYLPEVGNSFFSSFSLTTRRSKLGRSWLTNPWYGSMGTSLPYARAVCREVRRRGSDDVPVVLTGDGGFHFQSSELVHFQREALDVVIVLLRNDVFQLGKSCDSAIYDACAPEFDAVRLVEAYGGRGVRCRLAGELRACLADALRSPRGIQLIEVRVDLDDAHRSEEVRTIDTYIRAKAGVEREMEAWKALVAGEAPALAADER